MSDAAWLWIIGFLIVAGPLYLFLAVYSGVRAEKRREAGFAAAAKRINADFCSADQAVLQWFPDGRPFHPRADWVAAHGVMRGVVNDVHSIFFDLWASTPEPTSESDTLDQQTVAMFHFGEGGLPAFQLDRVRPGSESDHHLSTQRPRIMLPHRPAFSERFHLVGEDAAAVTSLFTAKLCAFVEAHEEWSIQSTGTWLAICRRRVRTKLKAYPTFVSEAAEFLVAFGTRG